MDLPDHATLSLLAAVGLAAVHIFSQQLRMLAGAVLLNVLKEELPAERQSRYWTFLAAGSVYATFLLAF